MARLQPVRAQQVGAALFLDQIGCLSLGNGGQHEIFELALGSRLGNELASWVNTICDDMRRASIDAKRLRQSVGQGRVLSRALFGSEGLDRGAQQGTIAGHAGAHKGQN